jgi:hypothetical protein
MVICPSEVVENGRVLDVIVSTVYRMDQTGTTRSGWTSVVSSGLDGGLIFVGWIVYIVCT